MCKVNSSLYLHSTSRKASGQTHWIPNADVFVMDDMLVIKVELAGVRQEDLEVAIEGQRLRISGQRPDRCRAPGGKFLVMEINYGAFECVLEIPPEFNLRRAEASYHNGFLRVDVPQTTHATPTKKVKVHATEPK